MSSADNHGQRFMKGRGSYARPALEIAEAFPLLSARLSAIARRFAAIVAVLGMAGALGSRAASGLAPTVAGVIAAITGNGQGIAGTAQISVIALRALGSNGQGSSLNTSQAIRWAADQGAKVINLSLGTNETFVGPTDIQLAVNYAWSKGALIVAAAGNSGTSTLDYPARLANVVSVAAIDESGTRASFSNYGPGLDLSAPGTRIVTLSGGNKPPNNRPYPPRTPFSTPFVTGAAALVLSVDPTLTNLELWDILNSTALPPAGAHRPDNPDSRP